MSNEKHPLELKFEEVAGKPPVRQREISEINREIKNHEGMTKLLHLLKDFPANGRLLYLHPLDLFGREGRYQPPYLYFGKCSGTKQGESYISRALKALQIDHKARSSLSLNKVLGQLGIDAEKQEMLGQDFVDAIVYALVILFRSSPPLRSMLQSEEFNYGILRSTMKDYSNILDEKTLEETLTSILADASSDPDLIGLIERLILTFVPLATRSSIEFLEMTKISQSEIAIAYHQAALSFLNDLLRKVSVSFDEYVDLLDQLYLYRLIENGNTIFWCENCSKEKISYYELHGLMAPSKMIGRKCRECNHTESFSSVFKVDSLLLETIFGRDHFLGAFLAWTLENANLDLELSVNVGEREIDVIVDDTLIECKAFRIGGRDETMRENLEQTVLQMKKQFSALEESGKPVKRGILFCNQPEAKNEISNIGSKTKHLIGRHNIEVFSYEDISEIIDALKS